MYVDTLIIVHASWLWYRHLDDSIGTLIIGIFWSYYTSGDQQKDACGVINRLRGASEPSGTGRVIVLHPCRIIRPPGHAATIPTKKRRFYRPFPRGLSYLDHTVVNPFGTTYREGKLGRREIMTSAASRRISPGVCSRRCARSTARDGAPRARCVVILLCVFFTLFCGDCTDHRAHPRFPLNYLHNSGQTCPWSVWSSLCCRAGAA